MPQVLAAVAQAMGLVAESAVAHHFVVWAAPEALAVPLAAPLLMLLVLLVSVLAAIA